MSKTVSEKCPYCNRVVYYKSLSRHIKCCIKNPENVASEEPILLTTTNIEQLQALPKSLKAQQKILYTCLCCNEDVLLKSFNSFKGFNTCPKCARKATCQTLYGGNAPACSKTVTNKQKETLAKRSKEEIEESNKKRKETCRLKFGVDAVGQNAEIRARQIATLVNKTKAEKLAIQRKRNQTMQQKYGEKHALQVQIFKKLAREHYEQTCQAKYGMKHAPRSSFTYQNEVFDSSWELAVWIWAKENNIGIKRLPVSFEYTFEGKKHTYYPDFEIDGKLVEIKGDLFFDANGKMINPFVKDDNGLFEAKHLCGVMNKVEFWTAKNVQPALDYVYGKYTEDFLQLFKNNLPFPYPTLKQDDYSILKYFHKSVYEASKKGCLSPLQAWQDKDIILKSALNRLKYVGRCTPADVLTGFSVAHISPRISLFKPSKATDLVKKYLNAFSEVFDPFSGFSGRMLGVTKLNKKYIGQDIHIKHVKESNEIIKYKNLSNLAQVRVQDILTDTEKSYECLFTCPPYGGKEHWNENNDEVEKSCDEWIDLCLEKYKCKKYLFVIDKTEKYKDFIVEELVNRSHFGTNKEFVVLI